MLSSRESFYIQETNRLKVKEWKKVFHVKGILGRAEGLDQYQTKQTQVKNCHKRQERILNTTKQVNSSRKQDNYKHMYTKQQSPKIHEANTDKIEGKNRQFYDKRLQYKTYNNEQNIQTDDQQGNSGFKEHCKPIRSNKTYKDTLTKRAAAAAKSLQSCPTLYDPNDGSPPGSSVPGVLQAKNAGVGCHFLLQCMYTC